MLSGAHSLEVPYLFQTDKTLYDPVMDIGKKVVQCGRKVCLNFLVLCFYTWHDLCLFRLYFINGLNNYDNSSFIVPLTSIIFLF